ncbi:MAG TPA: hypothetical protein VF135_01430 [Terriglobales bacterium]
MNHLSEEQLVQSYYKDVDGSAEREAHLAACAECREQLEKLTATLDSLAAFEVPERGEKYGEDVWNRIRAHLPEQQRRRWFAWPRLQGWVTAGAIAVLIVGAFLLGRFSKPAAPGGNTPTVAHKESDKEKKVLLVALGDHLDRSQMILVELTHASRTGDVDISSEQERAGQLLASNRLYRQAAERSGDADVAAVLDELERVLTEVAHEPSRLDGQELGSIQKRIESRGILFKVRVIGSKVRGEERRERTDVPAAKTTRQTI